MVAWIIAIDIIQDVRGSVGMYLFIIEESIQTIGMSCYIAKNAGKIDRAKELAQYAINNLIDPALQFVEDYGDLAYPLNLAYKEFYSAAKETMNTYLEL